jgi:hypothetical protein
MAGVTSIEGGKMTARPSQVLLIWVQSELQAARSGRRRAGAHPSDSLALVENLERLALELQSQQKAEDGP